MNTPSHCTCRIQLNGLKYDPFIEKIFICMFLKGIYVVTINMTLLY